MGSKAQEIHHGCVSWLMMSLAHVHALTSVSLQSLPSDRANVLSVPYLRSKLGLRLLAEILVFGVECSLLLIAP